MTWVIRSETEKDDDGSPLYWSNSIGWVDRKSADKFDNKDFNLPIGGKWEEHRMSEKQLEKYREAKQKLFDLLNGAVDSFDKEHGIKRTRTSCRYANSNITDLVYELLSEFPKD